MSPTPASTAASPSPRCRTPARSATPRPACPNAASGGGSATAGNTSWPIMPAPAANTSNGAQRTGGVSTINTGCVHGLAVGQQVSVAGVADASFNGSFTVTAVPNPGAFSYAQAGLPDAVSGDGSANAGASPAVAAGMLPFQQLRGGRRQHRPGQLAVRPAGHRRGGQQRHPGQHRAGLRQPVGDRPGRRRPGGAQRVGPAAAAGRRTAAGARPAELPDRLRRHLRLGGGDAGRPGRPDQRGPARHRQRQLGDPGPGCPGPVRAEHPATGHHGAARGVRLLDHPDQPGPGPGLRPVEPEPAGQLAVQPARLDDHRHRCVHRQRGGPGHHADRAVAHQRGRADPAGPGRHRRRQLVLPAGDRDRAVRQAQPARGVTGAAGDGEQPVQRGRPDRRVAEPDHPGAEPAGRLRQQPADAGRRADAGHPGRLLRRAVRPGQLAVAGDLLPDRWDAGRGHAGHDDAADPLHPVRVGDRVGRPGLDRRRPAELHRHLLPAGAARCRLQPADHAGPGLRRQAGQLPGAEAADAGLRGRRLRLPGRAVHADRGDRAGAVRWAGGLGAARPVRGHRRPAVRGQPDPAVRDPVRIGQADRAAALHHGAERLAGLDQQQEQQRPGRHVGHAEPGRRPQPGRGPGRRLPHGAGRAAAQFRPGLVGQRGR